MEIRHYQNYGSQMIYLSIDEAIDLTSSLIYFVPDQRISRKDKLDMLSARIREISGGRRGYSTVGMSVPILCLLSWPWIMETKPTMRANWSYQDVEDKVWGISR